MDKGDNMMNVYKIYDDEWSTISGSGQLREFTIDQVSDMFYMNSFEEIDDYIDTYMTKKNRKFAKELMRKFKDDDTALNNVSEEFLIDLLKTRGFEVKLLTVY
jgi:hypothetical protein